MDKEKIKTEKPKYKICEECGERVKAQGYGGHLFLKHNKKIGLSGRLNDVQGRLDKIENVNGNPDVESIEDLADLLKNALERIDTLENFTSRILYDPDKTLWMEEKDWDKYSLAKEEDDDDEEDEDDDEKNPGDDDEEDEDDDEKNPDEDDGEEENPDEEKGFLTKIKEFFFGSDDEESEDDDEKNPDEEDD